MAKGNKQQYKQFNINSLQDGCIALGMLIAEVTKNLRKYKEYASEADTLLEKVCETEEEFISAKEYEDINDKLLFRQREILRFVADYQDCSFSYAYLRKILEKKGYIKLPLSKEVSSILSDLLDIRNWSFHNPQSMLVASKEVAEKSIPPALRDIIKVKPQINPVYICMVEKYEVVYLASLCLHTERRITQFEHVLLSMKADYQGMYDCIGDNQLLVPGQGFCSQVQYVEEYRTAEICGSGSDVVQLSMAIQKSKYDGSEEKFKEATIHFDEE